jgi:ATP-dependent DNA helicase RecG
MSLSDKVRFLPYVGPGYASRLARLNIITIEDLLRHLPVRYDDFTHPVKIASLQPGELATVSGELLEIKNQYTRGGFVLQTATIKDDTGELGLIWFNQPYLIRGFKKNEIYSFQGKVERAGKKLIIKSPKRGYGTGLVPVYPETAGVTSKFINNRVAYVLKNLEIPDPYLYETPLNKALKFVHFPNTPEEAQTGRRRLAFDEILMFNLQSRKRKEQWRETILGHQLEISKFKKDLTKFVNNLPFELTGAQKRVINEIYLDLAKNKPMNRLLQGDVGSGKTVVAAIAMLAAYLNGFKAILMAPTEILAEQHFATLSKLLDINIGLATGSRKINTNFDILVGTHALLNLKLLKLGLVVIDEQHRFGVEQRAKLIQKTGSHMPHTLTMTATPIPRTIALTVFGDLDISVIDEMPTGRHPVKTWCVSEQKRKAAYDWIGKQNSQTFIICPFIEPSETLETVKSAKLEFEKISKIFSNLKVGLLHGRLKPKEKTEVLNNFRDRKLDILVSTPVVEVGVDIPGATIIVVEDADRFGLAQLHQLRGRVGRNDQQSYCLLFGFSSRLRYMEKTNSGLELAEYDLKYRGAGDLFGTAQHGRILNIEPKSIIETSEIAEKIYRDLDNFPILKKKLEEATIKTVAPN